MKNILISIAIIIAMGSLFAMPKELSKNGNPSLYKQLYKQARQNISALPTPNKKALNKLLNDKPDILMAYLIAYESNANLSIANPQDIASNYSAIAALLDKEGLRYSPEFFLSYIAKQTVSDEAITPYRTALLDDGLNSVLRGTDNDIDRFRATTLWCVSRLKFQQTSGRDQSPLDITQKSLLGRCEEMQILLVAAARTVGLPARPASAPWWAHMDNNHAWAEVFLDGEWCYTGDMDAAWFPNQTWFSGMIDKTVLILADGSLASENDEILAKGKYDTLINSTRNYSKERTRSIKLLVKDSSGKPVSDATVVPMVFNWGSLRALSYLKTDAKGQLMFSVGRGAFFISIYARGEQALEFVTSSDAEQIDVVAITSPNNLAGGWQIMRYPGNPMQWRNPPDSYKAAVQQEKDRMRQMNEAIDAAATSPRANGDSLSYEVAKSCRGNHPAFWEFVERCGTQQYPQFLELLLNMDPKLLWQASAQQFEAVFHHWQRYSGEQLADEEQLSLFSPSVFYEELPVPYKDARGNYQLYPEKLLFNNVSGREGIITVLKGIKKKYRINAEKSLSGLIPFNVAAQQKRLSPVQYRIFAVSVLRANGFAAEFSRIPNLIAVHVDDDWQYVNVQSLHWEDRSTKEESRTYQLTLQISDEYGIPIKIGEEQLNICRYVEGTFYPLINNFDSLGAGKYRGVFPADNAYLHFGYRVSDSETRFYSTAINPKVNDSLYIAISAPAFPRTWKAADEDILAMFDEASLEQYNLILIGNHDSENSIRIADRLSAEGKSFLWIGFAENLAISNYRVNAAWQNKVSNDSGNSMRSITLIKVDGQWQMFEGRWDKLPR